MRIKGSGPGPVEVGGSIPKSETPRKADRPASNDLANSFQQDGFDSGISHGRSSKDAELLGATTDQPTQTAEPSLVKVDKAVPQYTAETGQLFNGPVAPEQVLQGGLGDCFFLSSLASVAQRQPDLIKNNITDNGDGTYSVKFFKPQTDGSYQPTSVTVDNQIPIGKDGPAYASAPDENNQLWVSIYEKAFAQLQGGYKVLNKGGDEADAMQALTGKPAASTDIDPKNADAIYDQLKTAIDNGQLTTAGTFSQKDVSKALAKDKKEGLTDFDPKTFDYDKFGMVEGHAYQVMGVGTDDAGNKVVSLRNPWGETEPGNDGKDDGEFKLPLNQFAVLYQTYSIGG
jgi:hypothetical protein